MSTPVKFPGAKKALAMLRAGTFTPPSALVTWLEGRGQTLEQAHAEVLDRLDRISGSTDKDGNPTAGALVASCILRELMAVASLGNLAEVQSPDELLGRILTIAHAGHLTPKNIRDLLPMVDLARGIVSDDLLERLQALEGRVVRSGPKPLPPGAPPTPTPDTEAA